MIELGAVFQSLAVSRLTLSLAALDLKSSLHSLIDKILSMWRAALISLSEYITDEKVGKYLLGIVDFQVSNTPVDSKLFTNYYWV